ncbi:polysaccharide deacetylase family protein [Anaeromicropila herbilytica]|uniref:NodB homology domain-containing protein n=1 Tax=Anaeromicropila herbilytica TaxID=2785025 RepID=A0A7R7IBY4_9FIRM|nr:polysaccharide deacetylase family protein [Anaeromicropila herbilytica]BCN30138.1 hypothetical protein bsdtb5_14330 [Anaeromicropila herbilytica]
MKYKSLFNVIFIAFALLVIGASYRHNEMVQSNEKEKLDQLASNENAEIVTAMNNNTNEESGIGIIPGSSNSLENNTDNMPEYAKKYPDMYVTSAIADNLEDGKKIAYLTFDDGPSYVTKEILDTLDQNDIKATFFILGSTMTEEGEEYLKRMVEEGHAVGIHTFSHRNNIYDSVDSYLDDFYKAFEQIYDITGVKPTIFRFPYGSINSYNKKIKYELISEMERRGFTYYDWNVCANDSIGNPTEHSILSNVLKGLKKYCKPVILLHDASINEKTAKILPRIIDKIKEAGFEFDTVDKRTPCQFFYK